MLRKYRAFCELHHKLKKRYPNIEFPSSVSQILGFSTNVSTFISSKRRTVIEDRKRALQQYLNDLVRLINVEECPILREFLGVNEFLESTQQDDRSRRDSSDCNSKENADISRYSKFEMSKYSPKSRGGTSRLGFNPGRGKQEGGSFYERNTAQYESNISDVSPYRNRTSRPLT